MRKLLSFLYHMLPVVCGGVLMIVFGIIGWTDAGNPGAGAGAVLGLSLGTVFGFLAANILALLFGGVATGDPNAQNAANAPSRSVGGFIYRAIVIAAMLVVLHESYWFGNMWTATVNYNTGAYMTRSAAQNYTQQDLQTDLQSQGWRHDVLAARPLKWLYEDEARTLNQANREVIAVVTSSIIAEPGSRLREIPATGKLAMLWGSSNWFEPEITDRALSNYGTAVCAATVNAIEKHQSRGLILRFLPRSWFR